MTLRSGCIWRLAGTLMLAGSAAWAQQTGTPVVLTAAQRFAVELGPGQSTVPLPARLSSGERTLISVVSQLPTLRVELILPNGTRITPDNAALFDADFVRDDGGEFQPGSLLILPPCIMAPSGSVVHRYTMTVQAAGVYTVELSCPQPLTNWYSVVTEVLPESTLQSGLLALSSFDVVGAPISINGILADGSDPVLGAVYRATVLPPGNAPPQVVVLHDDAVMPDQAVGDGIYSAFYTPQAPGKYMVFARATGTRAGGEIFARTNITTFSVRARPAQFKRPAQPVAEWEFIGGEPLPSRLRFDALVTIATPGTYHLTAQLRSPAGATFLLVGEPVTVEAPIVSKIMSAAISADPIRHQHEPGDNEHPWVIDDATLYFHDAADGAVPIDGLADLSTENGGVQVVGDPQYLGGPRLSFPQSCLFSPTDGPDEGSLYDLLQVFIPIDCRYGGRFGYRATLMTDCGVAIQTVEGVVNLVATPDWQYIQINFDGNAIGRRGIDGPYSVTDLMIWDNVNGGAASRSVVCRSEPWQAALFDGYILPPDANHNGVPDPCDIYWGTSTDRNLNGVPDESDPDFCLADIVGIGGLPPPDGQITGDDFIAFMNAFATGDMLADVVGIGGLPPPDGLVTGDDFNAFLNAFATGCSQEPINP